MSRALNWQRQRIRPIRPMCSLNTALRRTRRLGGSLKRTCRCKLGASWSATTRDATRVRNSLPASNRDNAAGDEPFPTLVEPRNMNPSNQTGTPAPFTGAKLALVTVAVALATFMDVLDSSIANVAVPALSGNLGVSVDQGTWVITLYSAANAVAIPLTGWLTQRVGAIKLFVASILLFTLSSCVCGLSPNLITLLGARIVQ